MKAKAASQRELIVVSGSALNPTEMTPTAFSAMPSHSQLNDILAKFSATIAPVFPITEGIRFSPADPMTPSADQSRFVRVIADDAKLESIAALLNERPEVSAAYIKPPVYLPIAPPDDSIGPPATSLYESRQGYLDPAPNGVDARFAWTVSGGKGTGIQVFDVEGDWNFSHEDLPSSPGQVDGGNPTTDIAGWRNHGTAVLGEIAGVQNSFGITGISPGVTFGAVSHIATSLNPGWGSASAINAAASRCNAGDIILLEMHRPGPRYNFQALSQNDQHGFIAVEWWPDDLRAIQAATARGIIVIEAAGNGFENLDAALYNQRPSTPPYVFPATWQNPFARTAVDSAAIIVGAGAPPSGSFGPGRSRLDFSNFAACVDAQGWGREVVSTGYGDLSGSASENSMYTAQFSGTSSASPIVVGAIACIQGMLKAAGKPLLTPATARQLLRSTGSQQPNPGQRIGNLPDIRAMASQLQVSAGGGGGGTNANVAYLTQVLYYSRLHSDLRACLQSQICGGANSGPCSAQNQQIVNDVTGVLARSPQNYKGWFCQNL